MVYETLPGKRKSKRTWGVDQVVEHLPSKWEALSSIPSDAKKKKKKKWEERK
jgi:hypothetical protein